MADISTFGEYVFFPCDEGSGSTLTSTGDATISLDLTGSEATTWANSGYATFDGTNYFSKLISSLSAGAQSILAMDEGIIFSWAIINAASQSGTSVAYRVGGGNGGEAGYEGRLQASDFPSGRLRDVSGFKDVTASGAIELNTDTLVCWVFNNSALVKQAYFYRKYRQTLGGVDLVGIGDVPIVESATSFISIGAGIFSGSPQLEISGKLKNIGILNCGNKMPVGIDNFVMQLVESGGTP